MELRFTPHPDSIDTMTQDELRKLFLIDSLFIRDSIKMVYTDLDRAIIGSAIPLENDLKLISSKKEMAVDYFTQRREIGIINIGDKGIITVDGKKYNLDCKDGLYIGRGCREILFTSENLTKPARFYFVSYPAHKEYPTTHIKFKDTATQKLGNQIDANKRTIYKYIHPDSVNSCQIVMGLTELDEGSVWNTMPPHTHQRRTEIYMYFNMKNDNFLIHLFGKVPNTKHIIVRNFQAVISPLWSFHSGVGTGPYSFVWSMGGENQSFDDMDPIKKDQLK